MSGHYRMSLTFLSFPTNSHLPRLSLLTKDRHHVIRYTVGSQTLLEAGTQGQIKQSFWPLHILKSCLPDWQVYLVLACLTSVPSSFHHPFAKKQYTYIQASKHPSGNQLLTWQTLEDTFLHSRSMKWAQRHAGKTHSFRGRRKQWFVRWTNEARHNFGPHHWKQRWFELWRAYERILT